MHFAATCAAALSLLTLSACATIMEGSQDNVNIATSPPAHSNCTIGNSRGKLVNVAPATVIVPKSISDLTVSCADPTTASTGQVHVASAVEPWDFANILNGGLGMLVDWYSGAAYRYPENILVPLTAPSYPAPATVLTPSPAPIPMDAAPVYTPPAVAPAPVTPIP